MKDQKLVTKKLIYNADRNKNNERVGTGKME